MVGALGHGGTGTNSCTETWNPIRYCQKLNGKMSFRCHNNEKFANSEKDHLNSISIFHLIVKYPIIQFDYMSKSKNCPPGKKNAIV